MKKWHVPFTRIVDGFVEVEANSPAEAIKKAEELYELNGEEAVTVTNRELYFANDGEENTVEEDQDG